MSGGGGLPPLNLSAGPATSEAGSGYGGNANAAELVFKSGMKPETVALLAVAVAGASFYLGRKI